MPSSTELYNERMNQVKDGLNVSCSLSRVVLKKRDEAAVSILCHLGATVSCVGVAALSALVRIRSCRPAMLVARSVVCGASVIGGMMSWNTFACWKQHLVQIEDVRSDLGWDFQKWLMLEDAVMLARSRKSLEEPKLSKRIDDLRTKHATMEQLVTALQPPRSLFFCGNCGVAE